MSIGGIETCPVWVSEHYLPDAAADLVLEQANRLGSVAGWQGTVVLASEHTVFGLFVATVADDVRAALAAVGMHPANLSGGVLVRPVPDRVVKGAPA